MMTIGSHWDHPTDEVKLNFDGSYCSNINKGDIGGLIRDATLSTVGLFL